MFDALDTNKDGQISHQEWAVLESRMMAKLAEVPGGDTEENRRSSDRTLEAEFRKLDSNGDGSVTFAEWQANNKPSPCPGCTQITPGWVPLTPRH